VVNIRTARFNITKHILFAVSMCVDCPVSFNNDTRGLNNDRQVAVLYYVEK